MSHLNQSPKNSSCQRTLNLGWLLILCWFYIGVAYLHATAAPDEQQSPSSDSAGVPAIYYGLILTSMTVPGFIPEAGMPVEASINHVLCGESQTTQNDRGEIIYQIQVLPDSAVGGKPGCGAFGLIVDFTVRSQPMEPSAMWDNTTVLEWPLRPAVVTPTPTATPTATITPPTVTPLPTTVTPPSAPTPIPEPITIVLFGAGLVGLSVLGMFHRK